METFTIVDETWLSKKPAADAFSVTAIAAFLLFVASTCFFMGFFHAEEWLPATRRAVFENHEFWRAWTTLFAHAGPEHLLSNALVFIPLTYFLSGYFGLFLIPFLGIAMGGMINLLVLQTLPREASLIGISGVAYWLGATWLTLYVLIDTRVRLRRRLSYALFLFVMLFVPDTYKPEISYLSHFLGFAFGIFSGLAIYILKRKKIHAAESRIEIIEDHDDLESELLAPDRLAGVVLDDQSRFLG